MPILQPASITRTAGVVTSFDAGRGCPFQCSFCTIINVQGRKSRYRTPDDVEAIIRANLAQGISHFFITDDNLARNKNWEPMFDRMIAMRAEGLSSISSSRSTRSAIGFRASSRRRRRRGCAGCFSGWRTSIPTASSAQRRSRTGSPNIARCCWPGRRSAASLTPAISSASRPTRRRRIVRDIKIIQRELPLDLLEFFCLTPLPGSEDHKRLAASGIAMDPDMNKYDLEHVVTGHPKMSKEDWERAYRLAWETYYTPEHMETVMRRAVATGISPGKMMFLLMWFYGCVRIEKIHPLEGGYLRRKVRLDRRPGMTIENPLTFYPKYAFDLIAKHVAIGSVVWRMGKVRRAIKRDPNARNYMDEALTPVTDAELDGLEMFNVTTSARAAADKAKRQLTPA